MRRNQESKAPVCSILEKQSPSDIALMWSSNAHCNDLKGIGLVCP